MAKKWINTKEYKDWAEAVKKRDGYKCQVCGAKDKRLNSHHLIPKNFIKYRADITNGMTLCFGCHTGGRYSAHKHPLWFARWLELNHPHIYDICIMRIWEK